MGSVISYTVSWGFPKQVFQEGGAEITSPFRVQAQTWHITSSDTFPWLTRVTARPRLVVRVDYTGHGGKFIGRRLVQTSFENEQGL